MENHILKFTAINGFPSACSVEIYRRSGIVLVTDIDRGMSVTNACTIIANRIVAQYGINPHKMIFIERYRPGQADQTTDLVKFEFAGGLILTNPHWVHIPCKDFEEMIDIAQQTD